MESSGVVDASKAKSAAVRTVVGSTLSPAPSTRTTTVLQRSKIQQCKKCTHLICLCIVAYCCTTLKNHIPVSVHPSTSGIAAIILAILPAEFHGLLGNAVAAGAEPLEYERQLPRSSSSIFYGPDSNIPSALWLRQPVGRPSYCNANANAHARHSPKRTC